MDGAWKEKHAVLHNGKNNTVSQSEYNEKIEEYYKKRDEISRRDEHLFGKSQLSVQ